MGRAELLPEERNPCSPMTLKVIGTQVLFFYMSSSQKVPQQLHDICAPIITNMLLSVMPKKDPAASFLGVLFFWCLPAALVF